MDEDTHLTVTSDVAASAARVSRAGGRPSLDQRKRLVLALEAVPAMADPATRAAVLGLLPANIASSLPRSPVTRVDLLGVVDTCLAFPDGLVRLWEAVCLVDMGTRARDTLAGVLADMSDFGESANGTVR